MATYRMMTPGRRRILRQLQDGPLDEMDRVILQIRRSALDELTEMGLIKYRPFGKPPTWVLTDAGKEALK